MKQYAAPAAVAIALILVAVVAFWPGSDHGSHGGGDHGSGDQVELTMHIMSQCPYGVKVVNAVTPIARKLGPRFKLNLQYIGRERDGELTSMHGESEVAGNKLQLCVGEHAPYEKWLDFLDCQNENWRSIPEGWERCASSNEIDVNAVRSCYEGDQGTELLRASFQASEQAEARGSPTIFLASNRYSGGRSESAFARAICGQYGDGERPGYCSEIPPPPSVPVTVLVDGRCDRPECQTEQEVARLKTRIPGAKVSEVDFSSSEGRQLFEKAGLKMLPALLIGREIQQDPDAFRSLRGLKRSDDVYIQVLGRFDPTKGEWLERPEVPVRFFVDARCKSRECEMIDRFESFIKRQVPKAQVSRVEYTSTEGKALWKTVKAAAGKAPEKAGRPQRELGLPLALFGEAITLEEEAFSRLERRFQKVGDEYMFQLGSWDPTAEICDNESDDDGDGQADCQDSDCREQMVCRPEKARELRAFVMSECPYGIQVLNAMEEVLENFGRDRSKLDFRVEFVGQVRPDGELSTMHGQSELDENIREACAQKHYAKNYKFMDYVLCRNKNIRSDAWQECATDGIEANVIERCVESGEGNRLMKTSFELANSLGFRGSPSWLLNNKLSINARDPESIKTAFCEHNEQPECSNTLTKTAPSRGGGGGGGGGGSCG
jgi:predicted DsbA family dithiol-disulfide isomerase